MLQLLRQSPRWFSSHTVLAGLRYRLQNLMGTEGKILPEHILDGSALTDDSDFRQLSFTFAVIALSARVACIDGLSREKYVAFRESFPLKGSVCGKIRALFTLACTNTTPLEQYASQIKYAFPGKSGLFVSLVDRLFRIAASDGAISRDEERMLAAIARILELNPAEYSAIHQRYDRPPQTATKRQAHKVLGLPARASEHTLKKRYRELMKHYHPDRFAGQELSPELEMLLKVKSSEISAAYRTLAKKAA